jgi:hypothetical protein
VTQRGAKERVWDDFGKKERTEMREMKRLIFFLNGDAIKELVIEEKVLGSGGNNIMVYPSC